MCEFICVLERADGFLHHVHMRILAGVLQMHPHGCIMDWESACVQHSNVCVGLRDPCPYVQGSIYVYVFMKPYVEGGCELQTQHAPV